jgi:hypothetical protein
LQQVVAEALSALRDDPQHHLHPYYRQRLYEQVRALKGPDAPTTRGAHGLTFGERLLGWLAVLSAERVLPIYEAAPQEMKRYMKAGYGSPPDLLNLARSTIQGRVDRKEASSIASDAHEIYGNALNESEYDPQGFPLGAVLAAIAIKGALEEATGEDPVTSYARAAGKSEDWPEPPTGTSQYSKNTGVGAASTGHTTQQKDPFLELLEHAGPDAAADASAAYAWDPKATRYDPAKLHGFWTWWLTEALPAAWKLATGKTEPI